MSAERPRTTRSTNTRSRRRRRRVRTGFGALGLLLLILSIPSTTAWADGTDEGSSAAAWSFIGSPFSPISRWFGTLPNLHSIYHGNIVDQGYDTLQRSTTSAMLSISNLCWYVTQGFVQFASDFNVLHGTFAYSIDHWIGSIGNLLLNGNGSGPVLLVLLILIPLGIAARSAVRTRNGGVFTKRMIGTVVILGIFTVMTSAAATATAPASGKDYTAPVASPVWFGQKAQSIVSGVTGGIGSLIDSNIGSTDTGASNLSCSALLQGMSDRLTAEKNTGKANANSVAAARGINSMYVRTAVAAAAVAQFGDNPYKDSAWCRALDWNSNSIGPTSVALTTYAGWKASEGDHSGKTGKLPGSPNGKAMVFGAGIDGDDIVYDKIIMGWGACAPSMDGDKVKFNIPKAWQKKSAEKGGGDWVTQSVCKAWWSGTSVDDSVPQGSPLDRAGDDAKAIAQLTDDPEVRSYINSIHGDDEGTNAIGTQAATSAAFGSVTSMIVIGGVALAAIAATIMALLYLFSTVLALLRGLFSEGPMFAGVAKTAASFLGATIFAVGLGLILSLITAMTYLLIALGNSLGGDGNPLSLLWAGISPALSVVGLHILFKKVFKLPSPVTLAGGKAWGSMLTKAGSARLGGAVAGSGLRGLQKARGAVAGRGGAGGRSTAGGRAGAGAGGNGRATVSRGTRAAADQMRARKNAKAAWRKDRLGTFAASPAGRAAGAVGRFARGLGAKSAGAAARMQIGKGRTLGGLARGSVDAMRRVIADPTKRVGKFVARYAKSDRLIPRIARGTGRVLASRPLRTAGAAAALVAGATALGPVGIAAGAVGGGMIAARRISAYRQRRSEFIADHIKQAETLAQKEADGQHARGHQDAAIGRGGRDEQAQRRFMRSQASRSRASTPPRPAGSPTVRRAAGGGTRRVAGRRGGGSRRGGQPGA